MTIILNYVFNQTSNTECVCVLALKFQKNCVLADTLMTTLIRSGCQHLSNKKDDQSKSISQLHCRWQCFGWTTARTHLLMITIKTEMIFETSSRKSQWRCSSPLNPPMLLLFDAVIHLNYLIYWLVERTQRSHIAHFWTSLLNDILTDNIVKNRFSIFFSLRIFSVKK